MSLLQYQEGRRRLIPSEIDHQLQQAVLRESESRKVCYASISRGGGPVTGQGQTHTARALCNAYPAEDRPTGPQADPESATYLSLTPV